MANCKERSAIRFDNAKKNCINDILAGATYSVMMDKLLNDKYDIGYKYSKAQAERAIYQARDIIRKDFQESMPHLLDDTVSRLLDIYTSAREINDNANAIKALQEIGKLSGLYVDKVKLDANIDNNVTINFGFDNEK